MSWDGGLTIEEPCRLYQEYRGLALTEDEVWTFDHDMAWNALRARLGMIQTVWKDQAR